MASGTKAVAGATLKGSGSVAKRGIISAGKSAIGTPTSEGLGKRILVGTGKGIGKQGQRHNCPHYYNKNSKCR